MASNTSPKGMDGTLEERRLRLEVGGLRLASQGIKTKELKLSMINFEIQSLTKE